ncbi:MAG: serine/threonine-protein kinase [Plesiomonas shigelloides]
MEIHHSNYIIKLNDIVGEGKFGYVQRIELFNHSGHHCGTYARKVFHPQGDVNLTEFRARFKKEVECQESCLHPNIAPIYLHNLECEEPWFVMELAECDLCEDLDEDRLSIEEKLNVIGMVLSAVYYMHSFVVPASMKNKKLLHRDIKPSNILRCAGGIYKISDFGLVKDFGTPLNMNGASATPLTTVATTMGTSAYMAPEVIKAGYYSEQSDIYSLGVLISDMGLSASIPKIDLVIGKCTHYTPKQRYQTVKDVLKDVKEIIREFKVLS